MTTPNDNNLLTNQNAGGSCGCGSHGHGAAATDAAAETHPCGCGIGRCSCGHKDACACTPGDCKCGHQTGTEPVYNTEAVQHEGGACCGGHGKDFTDPDVKNPDGTNPAVRTIEEADTYHEGTRWNGEQPRA